MSHKETRNSLDDLLFWFVFDGINIILFTSTALLQYKDEMYSICYYQRDSAKGKFFILESPHLSFNSLLFSTGCQRVT